MGRCGLCAGTMMLGRCHILCDDLQPAKQLAHSQSVQFSSVAQCRISANLPVVPDGPQLVITKLNVNDQNES